MKPYPLEAQIAQLVSRSEQTPLEPTGIDREFYLDLAEPIVRLAATWQDSRGIIEDPCEHREQEHIGGLFAASLAILIGAGRCQDLIETLCLALDSAASDLYHQKVAMQHDAAPRRSMQTAECPAASVKRGPGKCG